MRALSITEMLQAWEEGLAQSPAVRPLALLAAASEQPREHAAELSIGERDARLLTLREWTFGPELAGLVTCQTCRNMIEVTFRTGDLRIDARRDAVAASQLSVGAFEMQCRPPNSLDLAAIEGASDPQTARDRLLRRCLSDVRGDGVAVDIEQLSPEAVEAAIQQMADADPQGDLQFDISCPQCQHANETTFDIGAFFWDEIHAWAKRLLHEVHVLAAAYGWREADILSMSAWRRQFYLGCIGS
jgi:hypothetical protein